MDLVPLPKKITAKRGTVSLMDAWRLDAPTELTALECLEDLTFLKPEAKRTLTLRTGGQATHATSDEAYRLDCSPDRIELSAYTSTGIIRGVQTLRQLAHEESFDAFEYLCPVGFAIEPGVGLAGIDFGFGRDAECRELPHHGQRLFVRHAAVLRAV